jgi:ribosomal protein L35
MHFLYAFLFAFVAQAFAYPGPHPKQIKTESSVDKTAVVTEKIQIKRHDTGKHHHPHHKHDQKLHLNDHQFIAREKSFRGMSHIHRRHVFPRMHPRFDVQGRRH